MRHNTHIVYCVYARESVAASVGIVVVGDHHRHAGGRGGGRWGVAVESLE